MTKALTTVAGLLLVIFTFTACRTTKTNLNYFTADKRDSSHTRIWQSYEAKIQPGDRLSIFVTALNAESARPYNLSSGAAVPGSSSAGISVDPQGRILYPQLGFIKAAGLTRNELRDTLLGRLQTYLTDPVVTVDFANFKVTVLGEVTRQGPIPVENGSITILEALGQAGDIPLSGRRDSVLVIREFAGKREFGYVNLLSNESFKSPYFTLQQNDVVYVQMNDRKIKQEQEQNFTRNLSIATSVIAVISTLGLLIVNLTR